MTASASLQSAVKLIGYVSGVLTGPDFINTFKGNNMKFLLMIVMPLVLLMGIQASASEFHGHKVNEYLWDFSADGGSDTVAISLSGKEGARPLPLHAVITDINVWVETAVAGTGSTYSIGNSASATAFVNAASVGTMIQDYVVSPAVVPYAVSAANKQDVKLTIGTQASTGGKVHARIAYDY